MTRSHEHRTWSLFKYIKPHRSMNVAWNTRNVKSNWTIDMYACEKEEKNCNVHQ